MGKSKRDIYKDEERYSRGELSQLARRKMIQKHHGDASKYKRKPKHKGKYLPEDDENF